MTQEGSVAEAGRCLCGSLAFEVTAPPFDVIDCHCRFCQRATGSAYLVETLFDINEFRTTAGRPAIYEHRSAGSGKAIRIHFCATCGTKLWMTFARFPGKVGVFSGTFDRPDWFGPAEDRLHFFLSEAPLGRVLPAGAEVYDAHYFAAEGVPDTAHRFDRPTVVTPALREKARARLADAGRR